MSSILERARLAAAVLICGVLLFLSNYVQWGWQGFAPEPTSAQDVADVKAAAAILSRAIAPMTGIQPCDAVKSLAPNKFSMSDGDLTMATSTATDVILCFKGDIDYGDALKAAQARRLTWQGGIGGRKVIAFAPSAERFLEVAERNGLRLAPGELKEVSLYLEQMAAHDRGHRADYGWLIDPSLALDQEVLFGPYVSVQPGAYDLRLAFEPADATPCHQLADMLMIRVEVTANARTFRLAPEQDMPLIVRGSGAGCKLEGHVSFNAPDGADKLETPIWVRSPVQVRLTGYDLVLKR